MAKFKVLNCVTRATSVTTKIRKDKSGKAASYKEIKEIDCEPRFYGSQVVAIGDTIEITDKRLAEKARNNPDLQEIVETAKKAAKKD